MILTRNFQIRKQAHKNIKLAKIFSSDRKNINSYKALFKQIIKLESIKFEKEKRGYIAYDHVREHSSKELIKFKKLLDGLF